MSHYRTRNDKSFRPQSSDSESLEDDNYNTSYKITNADDIPDVVYVDQAYLQPAPSTQGVRPIQQFQSRPKKPSKSSFINSLHGLHITPKQAIPSSSSNKLDESTSSLDDTEEIDSQGYEDVRPPGPSTQISSSAVGRRGSRSREAVDRVHKAVNSVRETVDNAWQAFWRRSSETLGSIGLWILLPLLIALSVYFAKPFSPSVARGPNDFLRPIPYVDAGRLWSDAPPKPGIFNSVMDFLLRGAWPDEEPAKRTTHLWIVEHLQKSYAETADNSKEILAAGRSAAKYQPYVSELRQAVLNSNWDNKAQAALELTKVEKLLSLDLNIQLSNFQRRMRLYFERVREADLKTARLADQILPKDSWPSKEELAKKKLSTRGPLERFRDLFLSPERRQKTRTTQGDTVSEDSDEEIQGLEAAKIFHAVTGNLVATSTWVDASVVDANTALEVFSKIIYGLEEAAVEALNEHRSGPYDDRRRRTLWEQLLGKSRRFGLSESTAKSLEGFLGPILMAQRRIIDVQNTLIQIQREMAQLKNDLTSPNHVLGSRWTGKRVAELYDKMAERFEKSMAVLGRPSV
ncbi:hypothetical protein B0T21DRAFT_433578 [Apiosordaria backusii]|uniref:Uncharacterized protein n=1 Tax=Apiosordaria backusii TaxID=314023 RepID=A0AA40K1A2_9PEZI|nr:hypothetical protein B0T21DRAFT_433578 [Apiosordaria backusii]